MISRAETGILQVFPLLPRLRRPRVPRLRRLPERLWLECSFIEDAAVMHRHHGILLHINDEDRNWRDLFYPFERAVVIIEQPWQGMLERPG